MMGTTLLPPFATTNAHRDRRWRRSPRPTASACAERP